MASDFYKFMGMDRVVFSPDGYVQVPENGTGNSTILRVFGCGALASTLMVSAGTGLSADVPPQVANKTSVGLTLSTLHAVAPDEHLATVEDQILYIRHYLSLNVVDMSRVLRVERPTVYAWMAGKSEPHADNLARIRKIFKLAQAWHHLSDASLGPFASYGVADGSIIALLSEESVNDAAVRKAFGAIRPLVASRLQSRQKTASALAAELGYKEPSAKLSEQLLESNTFV